MTNNKPATRKEKFFEQIRKEIKIKEREINLEKFKIEAQLEVLEEAYKKRDDTSPEVMRWFISDKIEELKKQL